jgi:TPR repeat protein
MKASAFLLVFFFWLYSAPVFGQVEAPKPSLEATPQKTDSWLTRLLILNDWQMANGFYLGKGMPMRRGEALLLWQKIGKHAPDPEYPDIASVIGLANLQVGNFPAAIRAFEKAAVYYGPYFKNLDASRLSLVPSGNQEAKFLVRILDKNGLPLGSGVYIWKDGLVLTAAHVVNQKRGISVEDHEGKTHKVLGVFPGGFNSDLAALKTPGPSPDYLELAPGPLLQGDDLRILGFPFGSAVPIQSRGKAKSVVGVNVQSIELVETDLSSVPGYSGAPAIDTSGKMVGVVSMCRTDNPFAKNRKLGTFLVRYEDLTGFLGSLKKQKTFSALGNSEWGKKLPYWSADWAENDNRLAQALYYFKTEPEKGVEFFEEAAEEGSTSAWMLLGRIYFLGDGVAKNPQRAVRCFSRAAEMGEPSGMYFAGLSYLGGLGVEKDEIKGNQLLKQAADADYPQALIYYSVMYETGKTVPKNREMSLYYSRRAAQTMEETGITGHIYNLMRSTSNNENQKEIYEWSLILAKDGSPLGQHLLACCYLSGVGTDQDYAKAIELLHLAAEGGEAQAYLQLCVVNFLGKGTQVDYKEAERWGRKAAEAGIDKGHLFVFFCEAIPTEKTGAPVSAEAVQHLEKAVEMGLADAQFYYGQCLLEGLHGIKKDYAKALKLLKQAKEKGYEKASAYIPLAQAEVDKAQGK